MIIFIICLFIVLIFGVIQFSFLVPPVKGLPVLMYHKIDSSITPDYLNVQAEEFEKHLQYLIRKNYYPLLLSELVEYVQLGTSLPLNPVLITFDDGYKNNFTQMYPLLRKYNFKANIFLVSSFINRLPSPSDPNEYVTVEDIRNMDPTLVQYGLHSYDHMDYNKLDKEGMDTDLKKCKDQLLQLGVSFQPCFAFTYGSFPKKDIEKRNLLFEVLKMNNIQVAFRIGNRVNKLPLTNTLLIKRIDIRGTDSFFMFRIKLKKGRVKLFG